MRSLTLITLSVLFAASPVGAQVDPGNMRSGCVTYTDVFGLISSPLFVVPGGYRFVLTDVSVERVSQGSAIPSSGGMPVRLSINLGGTTPTSRWVGTDRLNPSDPPLRHHWTTGLVYEPGTVVEAAVSVTASPEPVVTVCWSGYLVSTTTTSVLPQPPGTGELGLQAWPNPAGESTELAFSLDRKQRVVVAVFAIDGRRVRTLRRGVLEAGEHLFTWDGRDDSGRPLGNGVYFAALETAGGRSARRIIRLH